MSIEYDPSPLLSDYAHPEALVTSSWLGAKLGTPGLAVVESDEDYLLYDIGHIPTAHRIHWDRDLNDHDQRDVISPEAFSQLMRNKGIRRDDTVVIYGDRSNLWAAYTFWVFRLYGHEDVRLLDGGRDAWMQEEKETSYSVPEEEDSHYPVVERDDSTTRIFVEELRGAITSSQPLQTLDLRAQNPAPKAHHKTGHESYYRQGKIPGSYPISWESFLHPNSRFKSRKDLEEIFRNLNPQQPTVTYCHTGERAAHASFVLHYLLGWDNVRTYDGSWVEWGNMIRTPIQRTQDTPTNTQDTPTHKGE